MKKILLISFLFFCSFCTSFAAPDIYTYTFGSTAGVPSYTDPLLTGTPLTAIGTGTATPCTWGFSGITGFAAPAYSSSGPCINITLTAAPGYTIDASRFYAYLRRSTTGPTAARMAYSTDGITWVNDGIDHPPTAGGCATSFAMTTLADYTFATITNPTLYFRIYPFGASSGGGTIQVYDLHIEGVVRLLCTNPVVTVTPVADSFCAGGAGVNLTAAGAGLGGSYKWAPASGLSATTGGMVTATPGITTVYTVIGTTALGCSDTTPVSVKVLPLPVAFISPSGSTTFCMGDTVRLTASTGTGYTYRWYNGPILIPGATNSYYTVNGSGSYTAEVTNDRGCVATSAPIATTVIPLPSVSIFSGGISVFCDGGGLTLSAVSPTGSAFQWYKFSTPIPGATSASYVADTTSVYTVVVTGPGGCKDTAVALSTWKLPKPKIFQNDTIFCEGNSIVLDMNVSGVTGLTYQWKRNGAVISGATDYIYAANIGGRYNCITTLNSSCISVSDSVDITVKPVRVPTLTYNGVFTTTKGFVSYQWYLNTIEIVGATSYTWRPKTNGSYRVRVLDTNGCATYSFGYNLRTVGVEMVNSSDLKIYPNPASSYIHVEAKSRIRAVVTDINGKIVAQEPNVTDMDISNLANGWYMITLFDADDKKLMVQKLIKE